MSNNCHWDDVSGGWKDDSIWSVGALLAMFVIISIFEFFERWYATMVTIIVLLAVLVGEYFFLSNAKATILIAIGSIIAVMGAYSISCDAICETAKKYWKGLMRTRSWQSTGFIYCIVVLFVALAFIFVIYLAYYIPREYSVNWYGVAWTLLSLMVAVYLAHVFGTLRGFIKYAY